MRTEVRMPRVSETAEEGIVVTWFVEPGDRVEQGALLAEVQVEKVSMDVEAPASGWLAARSVEPGGVVAQGELIAEIDDREPAAAAPTTPEAVPARPKETRVVASPSARRLARERGVDLAGVTGSGPGGRIQEGDVLTAAAETAQAASAAVPLGAQRRTIARRLHSWLADTAQLTLTAEADVTDLAERLAAWSATWGQRASYTAAAVAACAAALREHPRMAARLTDEGLVPATDLDIGVAVELEDALIVPVVRRADTGELRDLNRQITELAARARAGELTPDETRGGVFSVTNLGAYGIDGFTPLLNPPQTGILGIGRARQRPAVVGGALVPRMLVVLSLTFDHRVLDGAPAAAFLEDVVARLERPDRLEHAD
ncbi:MAG TPA: dihydrolipoamide acetyltransferase family protein [Egicoccus sp.]|nr:dihydrolipoamide acetyltransferase family protein [Egicoccus sp.]HSK21588.1 dihydrolipoamide acetyltransferase family protein [Egicoccus sp.]